MSGQRQLALDLASRAQACLECFERHRAWGRGPSTALVAGLEEVASHARAVLAALGGRRKQQRGGRDAIRSTCDALNAGQAALCRSWEQLIDGAHICCAPHEAEVVRALFGSHELIASAGLHMGGAVAARVLRAAVSTEPPPGRSYRSQGALVAAHMAVLQRLLDADPGPTSRTGLGGPVGHGGTAEERLRAAAEFTRTMEATIAAAECPTAPPAPRGDLPSEEEIDDQWG